MRSLVRLLVLFTFGLAAPAFAATSALTPTPVQRFEDNNGNACSGCKVFTYSAGTTTKVNTYVDSTQTTQNTDPIILNSRGEANIWMDQTLTYKFVLSPSTDTDPPTNAIWTVDQIPGGLANNVALSALPNIASGHLLANSGSSTGNVMDTTVTALLDRVFSSAQGALLYRGASAWAGLSVGTNGQFLQTQGASANPQWANASLPAQANNTFYGNNSGGSAAPGALTATAATAILNACVGDSGAGGTQGLVPAPPSGSTAAGKFLKANCTFVVPPGTPVGNIYVTVSGGAIASQTGTNLTAVRNGTGSFTISFTTTASNATYAVLCTAQANAHLEACMEDTGPGARSANSFSIDIHDGSGRIDPSGFSVVVIQNP